MQRFDYFKRKVSCNGKKRINAYGNNDILGYALKADIKHYFERVNHKILLNVIRRKIKEKIKLVKNDILPYDSLLDSLNGWFGYAMWANTYKLRKNLMSKIGEMFCNEIADKDIDRWVKVLHN